MEAIDYMAIWNVYQVPIIALTTLTSLLIWKREYWWPGFKFWWTNRIYGLPVIGKLSRLSKDISLSEDAAGNKWFNSESVLCSDYASHYNQRGESAQYYEQCETYLERAGDGQRKPLPLWGWVLIAALVYVEALGFAYVLSGFTIPGASEALQEKGAMGIAFMISAILVFATHVSGHEIYKNIVIRKIRKGWRIRKNQNEDIEIVGQNQISIVKSSLDDGAEDWKQMLNRTTHNDQVSTSNILTIGAAIIIVLIAIGAFYVRMNVLEIEAYEEHKNAVPSSASISSTFIRT